MNELFYSLSAYKSMWLVVMFDLPVHNSRKRKEYANFRNGLLKEGFAMLQYSVYIKFCASEESSKVHKKYVKKFLPSEGQVRFLNITDKQFEKMETIMNIKRVKNENKPEQLLLF